MSGWSKMTYLLIRFSFQDCSNLNFLSSNAFQHKNKKKSVSFVASWRHLIRQRVLLISTFPNDSDTELMGRESLFPMLCSFFILHVIILTEFTRPNPLRTARVCVAQLASEGLQASSRRNYRTLPNCNQFCFQL